MFDRLREAIQRKSAPANAEQVRNTSPATAIASTEVTGANVPWDEIEGLLRPGSGVPMPTAPVVESALDAMPAAPPSEEPATNPDERPIDWDEEASTALPMRTPGRIAFLPRFENPSQTRARIMNDAARYRNRSG